MQHLSGVARFMVEKSEDHDSLCSFLRKEMTLPFALHAVHRNVLLEVTLATNDGKRKLTLTDVLEIIAKCSPLKVSWMSFAADCAELFSSKGHFVEKTDEAA